MYIPPVCVWKQLQHAPPMETGDPDDVCGQVYTSKEQNSWIGCGTYMYVVVKFGGTTSVVCDEHCQF